MYTVVCPLDPGFVCTSEDGGTQDDELLSVPVEEMLQQLILQDQTELELPADIIILKSFY